MSLSFTWHGLVAIATVALVAAVPALGDYTRAEGNYMIDFCAASYCPASKIHAWSCETCKLHPRFEDILTIENDVTDTQAFTGYDASKNVVVLAFRGTDPLNIVNWIDDLDFIKVPYPACNGCYIHQGFFDSYNDVANITRAAVKKQMADHPGASLYVTGHSLGAALAEIAALDIVDTLGIQPALTMTFGCPRVGDSAWATYYHSRVGNHWRETHFADPVPHLPPELFGFHHTPVEVWYNELNTKYTICNGSGEDPHCADSIIPGLYLVTDHLTYQGLNLTETFLACRL